jgi:hypothetical protein
MDLEDFKRTLSLDVPPAGLGQHLLSLWYDAKDDWDKAHTTIQDINDTTAAWIHAYLHRKEGDLDNADYWYHRAGRKRPSASLQTNGNRLQAHCYMASSILRCNLGAL